MTDPCESYLHNAYPPQEGGVCTPFPAQRTDELMTSLWQAFASGQLQRQCLEKTEDAKGFHLISIEKTVYLLIAYYHGSSQVTWKIVSSQVDSEGAQIDRRCFRVGMSAVGYHLPQDSLNRRLQPDRRHHLREITYEGGSKGSSPLLYTLPGMRKPPPAAPQEEEDLLMQGVQIADNPSMKVQVSYGKLIVEAGNKKVSYSCPPDGKRCHFCSYVHQEELRQYALLVMQEREGGGRHFYRLTMSQEQIRWVRGGCGRINWEPLFSDLSPFNHPLRSLFISWDPFHERISMIHIRPEGQDHDGIFHIERRGGMMNFLSKKDNYVLHWPLMEGRLSFFPYEGGAVLPCITQYLGGLSLIGVDLLTGGTVYHLPLERLRQVRILAIQESDFLLLVEYAKEEPGLDLSLVDPITGEKISPWNVKVPPWCQDLSSMEVDLCITEKELCLVCKIFVEKPGKGSPIYLSSHPLTLPKIGRGFAREWTPQCPPDKTQQRGKKRLRGERSGGREVTQRPRIFSCEEDN